MNIDSAVLLVGPSGCGKTSLGQYAASELRNVKFEDLDDLVHRHTGVLPGEYLPKVGNDRFLASCREAAKRFVTPMPGRLTLLAVGAGALQSVHALGWISTSTSICLFAPAEVLHPRNPLGPGRDFTEYVATEYSQHRMRIYRSAQYLLNLDSLCLDSAKERFLGFLLGLIAAQAIRCRET